LTPAEVEAYLKEHIPLSAAMGIEVLEADTDRVVIEAPLHPANVNHRSTAFGGSVATIAILAGWTHVFVRLEAEGLLAQTVIQSSAVDYAAPIHAPFRAVSQGIDPRDWARFTRGITKHGKGRVRLPVTVMSEGEAVAEFRGAYVAIRQSP
jgi:thioesterase domain-containing protein